MTPNGSTGNPVTRMNRLVSEPYYLLHILVFFSYIPVRFSAADVLYSTRLYLLFRREIQAILTFCVLIAIKAVKTESWDAWIADTLFFAKIFLVAISLIMDYHLALWYTLAFSVLYIIAQQPASEEFGTSNQLTPLQLESLLSEGNTSRFWLVEFHSLSTSRFVASSSLFPDLSVTFSTKIVCFGSVDLGLFPNAAEKFGIALSSLHQLPIYILFHDGAEISRYPELDSEAQVFDSPLSKKLLCRHFELDKLLLDYVNGK